MKPYRMRNIIIMGSIFYCSYIYVEIIELFFISHFKVSHYMEFVFLCHNIYIYIYILKTTMVDKKKNGDVNLTSEIERGKSILSFY